MVYILGSLKQPSLTVFTQNFAHLEFFQSLLISLWKWFSWFPRTDNDRRAFEVRRQLSNLEPFNASVHFPVITAQVLQQELGFFFLPSYPLMRISVCDEGEPTNCRACLQHGAPWHRANETDHGLGGARIIGRCNRLPGVWFATALVDSQEQTTCPTNEGLICTSSPVNVAPSFNELTRV